MQALHKMGPPQMGGPPGSDAVNTQASDPQYNTQDGQRQGPPFAGGLQPANAQNANARNKPLGMMPPPSSPLTNGLQKPQQGAGKSDGANTDTSSSGSPHVAPATAGTATAPATPTSGQTTTGLAPSPSQILNNNNRFSTTTPINANATNPSRPPTAGMNTPAPPAPVNQPAPTLDPLAGSLDFMQGTFDDFDFSLNSLGENFDDISSWFNPSADLEV